MAGLKIFLKRVFLFVTRGVPVNHVSVNLVNLPPNDLLKGRWALITGGASGIGYAIAKAFLSAGASVILTGRDEDKLQGKKNELDNMRLGAGKVHVCVMDNMDVASFASAFGRCLSLAGGNGIDILVNNAGVDGEAMPNVTEEGYDRVLDTNLKGTFFLSQMVGKYMVEKQIRGNILNISSSSSLRPANSPYILSKWGIRALTLGLAKSLVSHGITVNSIAPGPTVTPLAKLKDTSDIACDAIPMGRYVMPEEIANMAVVLVSGLGRSIVGDTVFMTGGIGNLTVDDYAKRYAFE